MELLLVSPVKPMWIIVSKVLPYLLVSTVNFITILILSRYMMGVPLRGSLMLLSGVAVLFVFTSLSLGLLISVVASTQKSALLLSGMGLMMPTVLLSGIISVPVPSYPCQVVHHHGEEDNDTGGRLPLYRQGVQHTRRHDGFPACSERQEIQNKTVI